MGAIANVRLKADPAREAAIEMTAASFRRTGHQLVDRIAQWLEALPDGPVLCDESPDEVRDALDAARALPESGADPEALLDEAATLVFKHSTFNAHPRFFGYITSSPAPIGALGDLLASAVNQNVGAWRLAPLATEIEKQTVRWIAELIGFPADAGGLLVSGGNMANFVGLLAARTHAAPEVRTGGLRTAGRQLRVYASAEAHTWVQKACDLFGLGTDAVRLIPVDAAQQMRTDVLERRIVDDRECGDLPFLVVGTAGSTATGAIDPLWEIAAICRRRNVWFHVDGAYGAPAARVPGTPKALAALAQADSVSVDPHKWLYAPLEAGCVLVRRPAHLLHTFSYHPSYYSFDHGATNFFDLGPQNSRGFRALKVWLALRQVGFASYIKMIGDDIRLSRHLHQLINQHYDFEPITQSLSVTTFRYVPAHLRSPGPGPSERSESKAREEQLRRVNQELLARVERSGEAFLSNAIVDGRFALRACIVNFRTSLADIEALPPLLSRIGREVERDYAAMNDCHRAVSK